MSFRRAGLSPFGASLMDMMTCGFGAVVLLFILKANTLPEREARALTQLQARASSIAELDKARHELTAQVEELMEVNSTRIVPDVFGIPKIEGPLQVLIDVSGSMDNQVVRNRTTAVLSTLLASNPRITEIQVTRFATTVEDPPLVPWTSLADRRDLSWDALLAPSNELGLATDLLGALRAALRAVTDKGGGTVLVVSDGMQTVDLGRPIATSTDAVRWLDEALDAASSDRVTVHAIGLFAMDTERRVTLSGAAGDPFAVSAPCSRSVTVRDERLRLARLLHAVTTRWSGSFVGVPLQCVGS